jgi:Protein of unknown function (DUF3306)
MADHETFATRWNRRKLEAKQAEQAQVEPKIAPEQVSDGDGVTEPVDDTPLPTLDDVTPEGDVVAFLQKRVPAELQKLALRKAWASDPLISTFIEVAENQYDWNALDGVPGFGAMDPGWNVQELLAQAIGAVPAEAKDEISVAVGEAPNEPTVDELCDRTTQDAAGGDSSTIDEGLGALQQSVVLDKTASFAEDRGEPQELFLDAGSRAQRVQTVADIPEKTQRLAVHTNAATRAQRHGGALPDH